MSALGSIYDAYQATIADFLGAGVLAAAQADARARYPEESCGFVADGQYIACPNAAADKKNKFEIDDQRYANAVIKGTLKAVIHSHPGGPIFPNTHDMQQQVASGVAWIIISLNDTTIGHVVGWGGGLPRAPLLGRPFIHGVFDCYSAIRDLYAAGRDEALKQQFLDWPFPPITLPEFPRDDNWWQGDDDLYLTGFAKAGFKPVTRATAQPGDVYLMRLGNAVTNPKKKLCHGGILLARNQVFHHKPGRISGREPAGIWALAADMWVRYSP